MALGALRSDACFVHRSLISAWLGSRNNLACKAVRIRGAGRDAGAMQRGMQKPLHALSFAVCFGIAPCVLGFRFRVLKRFRFRVRFTFVGFRFKVFKV